jgi:lysylphosphatidylglycerol synthetase-like protein (DUF2156 family)
MRSTLVRILVGFAIAIAVVLALGGLFKLYSDSQFSEAKQQEVLIKAIPFVAVFVSIVLAFICLIVIVAVLFNGKVPLRAYRPIEALIIAGIIIGIAGLFQGWKLFAYEYGFLLLLISVLAFMIWSHLTPMPLRASRQRPPITQRAHLIGVIAGGVVWIVVAAAAINSSRPQEPYGFSPTVWSYMDEAQQQQTAQDAKDEYRTAKIPTFLLFSLLAGGVAYFAVRELVPAESQTSVDTSLPMGQAKLPPS